MCLGWQGWVLEPAPSGRRSRTSLLLDRSRSVFPSGRAGDLMLGQGEVEAFKFCVLPRAHAHAPNFSRHVEQQPWRVTCAGFELKRTTICVGGQTIGSS